MANTQHFSYLCAVLELLNIEINHELQAVSKVLEKSKTRRPIHYLYPQEYIGNRVRLARVSRLRKKARTVLDQMKFEDERLKVIEAQESH